MERKEFSHTVGDKGNRLNAFGKQLVLSTNVKDAYTLQPKIPLLSNTLSRNVCLCAPEQSHGSIIIGNSPKLETKISGVLYSNKNEGAMATHSSRGRDES